MSFFEDFVSQHEGVFLDMIRAGECSPSEIETLRKAGLNLKGELEDGRD